MQFEKLLLWWPVVLSGVSVAVSWGMDRSDKKNMERRMTQIETTQQQQSLSNLAISNALGRMDSINDRLGNIEQLLMQRARDN